MLEVKPKESNSNRIYTLNSSNHSTASSPSNKSESFDTVSKSVLKSLKKPHSHPAFPEITKSTADRLAERLAAHRPESPKPNYPSTKKNENESGTDSEEDEDMLNDLKATSAANFYHKKKIEKQSSRMISGLSSATYVEATPSPPNIATEKLLRGITGPMNHRSESVRSLTKKSQEFQKIIPSSSLSAFGSPVRHMSQDSSHSVGTLSVSGRQTPIRVQSNRNDENNSSNESTLNDDDVPLKEVRKKSRSRSRSSRRPIRVNGYSSDDDLTDGAPPDDSVLPNHLNSLHQDKRQILADEFRIQQQKLLANQKMRRSNSSPSLKSKMDNQSLLIAQSQMHQQQMWYMYQMATWQQHQAAAIQQIQEQMQDALQPVMLQNHNKVILPHMALLQNGKPYAMPNAGLMAGSVAGSNQGSVSGRKSRSSSPQPAPVVLTQAPPKINRQVNLSRSNSSSAILHKPMIDKIPNRPIEQVPAPTVAMTKKK
ncbi:hypothetical protein HK096_008863, partial [Nowakowskiella sp. JEL0078]